MRRTPGLVCLGSAVFVMLVSAAAVVRGHTQPPPQTPPQAPMQPPRVFGAVPPPTTPKGIEKLGPTVYRVGNVRIDTDKREVSVSGVVNDVQILEFIANTKGGYKAYESVLELDTNAIDFNVGLLLIGLERERSVTPKFHFDPTPPQGDPVEITVSWEDRGRRRRVAAEELVYNEMTKKTLPKGWVYTGSTFIPDTTAFVADLDGVLIGFVHSPAPLIEHASGFIGNYGAQKLNPNIGLKPGTTIELTVRALKRPPK